MSFLHGASAYRNSLCRCDVCTAAHRVRHQEESEVARKKNPQEIKHGSATCYNYYGCRCTECREAKAKAYREYKERKSNAEDFGSDQVQSGQR